MLHLHKRREWWGYQIEVTEDEPQTLAEVGYTIVAATLAEPIRRAFVAHLDEHGCGGPDGPGFIHCPQARELWDMLPDGDRIVIG